MAMRLFFSLISLLLIVGVIVWWSAQDAKTLLAPISVEEGIATSSAGQNTTGLTPIEKANDIKSILESKKPQSVEGV